MLSAFSQLLWSTSPLSGFQIGSIQPQQPCPASRSPPSSDTRFACGRSVVAWCKSPAAQSLGAAPIDDITSPGVDLQSDSSQYGRGERHLSAVVNEGDVVAYQTGRWLVDGVTVGVDDAPPAVAFCRLETMQIVWTHNCEHGVLRGMELIQQQQYVPRTSLDENTGVPADSPYNCSRTKDSTSLLVTDRVVEFGPEQLLARFPVEWSDEDETSCTPLVDLNEVDRWSMMTESF